jgi:Pyruvate/2-oxoacid:ferredoxin oxidoreductase delta subunit
VEKIYRRAKKTGIAREDLEKGLRRMAKKGAILGTEVGGKPHFSKAMLAIGMFEFQATRLTKELHADFTEYMGGEFGKVFHTKKTSQMRTIPINEEILPERKIGTYDAARDLVMKSEGRLAVIKCVCREGKDLQEDPCKLSDIRETCLLLGEFAEHALSSGAAQELSKEEMIGLLERADEVGMVLQPQNSQEPNFICCCCGCCCEVLTSVKKLPRPAEYFDTNYYAEVDQELCVECETCGDRCGMEAISYVDDVASVDPLWCIGCGLCVSTCPEEAIQLHEKAETKTPPKDQDALYMQIMVERFGPLGTAKIAAKKMLGMKI